MRQMGYMSCKANTDLWYKAELHNRYRLPPRVSPQELTIPFRMTMLPRWTRPNRLTLNASHSTNTLLM